MPPSEAHSPDWPALVFQEGFMASVDRMAKRRFGQDAMAEECTNYVIELLAQDDWQRCHQFQGRSKPTTFLVSLSNNLIEEFARKKFGRPRPPVWLKEQGELWVSLWKAVCLERQLVQSVVDRFCQNGLRAIEQVQSVIKTIKARIPTCGIGGAGVCESTDGDIESLSDSLGSATEQQDSALALESKVQKACFSILSAVLSEAGEGIEPLEEGSSFANLQADLKLTNKLTQLRQALQFTDEETLLLRLVFVDGLSKSKAAVAANMPAHKGGRIVNDALGRMREAFERCDLDLESLFKAVS